MKQMKKSKYKTPTERIQSFFRPDLESAWIKIFGKIKPAKMYERAKKYVKFESPDYLHTQVHTHPIEYPDDPYDRVGRGVHSPDDMDEFCKNSNILTSIVAQLNPKLRKVEGYTFLKKKRNFNISSRERKNLISELKNLGYQNFQDVLKSKNIQTRFVPVKGYEFNPSELIYQKKTDRGYRLGIIVFFVFLTILFFSQKKLTGFTILAGKTSPFPSIFILFIFLIGLTFYLIRKKRKNKFLFWKK